MINENALKAAERVAQKQFILISSTRRSGENGIRNWDEILPVIIEAYLEAACIQLHPSKLTVESAVKGEG